jgi:esterase/lipase
MDTLRTRIKKEIVAEFLPPTIGSDKVIIICGGMPSYSSKKDLMVFLAKKAYWVFVPRYRGSWESDGSFLKLSPHQDILDMFDQLQSGFSDLYGGKKYKVNNPMVYLVGSSFGGPAALLASRDKRVKKAVVLSPVIDWRVESNEGPIDRLNKFTRYAFGNGYRFTKENWNKLKTGKFYNPMNEINSFDPNKILIIHAKDDKTVYSKTSETFAKKIKCKLILLKKGGHLSTSNIMNTVFWEKINDFIRH